MWYLYSKILHCPSICNCQNGGCSHSITWWPKRDPGPLFNFHGETTATLYHHLAASSSSSNNPKDFNTLCCLVPLSLFKSDAYCCSRNSSLCCSSKADLWALRVRDLLINFSSSCLSSRFSVLMRLVCSFKQCIASCWKLEKENAYVKEAPDTLGFLRVCFFLILYTN